MQEIGLEQVETAMHNKKKGKATEADEVRLVVGDGWIGGSQVDRKATERVYAVGKDTDRVEDGPNSAESADMEEERGCA